MPTIEATAPVNEAAPKFQPEVHTLFDPAISKSMRSADDYAALYGKLEHEADNPDAIASFRDQRMRYDRVGQLLFEIPRDEHVWTMDSIRTSLEQRLVDSRTESAKFPNSKELARQVDGLELTLAHIDGYDPARSIGGYRMNTIRSERFYKSENALAELKKKSSGGEFQDSREVERSIDKAYKALCETEYGYDLEAKYGVLNEKLTELRDMGPEAVREYLLDLMRHYDTDADQTLTVDDISSLRLAFATFKDGSDLRGQTIERPVFIFDDDAQLKRITGGVSGFMSTRGVRHLMPSSGLDDLPIIVIGPNRMALRHEITHSMDIKCMQEERSGYEGALSEAIANLMMGSGAGSREGWSINSNPKTYYDQYSAELKDEEKISFEDFLQTVRDIEQSIASLQTSGYSKETIVKTMMICGKAAEFTDIVMGIEKLGQTAS